VHFKLPQHLKAEKNIHRSTATSNLKISLSKQINLVHYMSILSQIPKINFSIGTQIKHVCIPVLSPFGGIEKDNIPVS